MAGTEFIIECDRVLLAIGQGPELDWLVARLGRRERHQEPPPRGRRGHLLHRPARACSAPATCASARRPSSQAVAEGRRAAYAIDAYLKGMDLEAIRTRQTLAEPQPEFLSIVPYTERGQGAAAAPQGDARRGPQQELRRVRDPVHAAGGDGRVRPLPPVHVRGDRLLRPAAPGHRVRHDAQDARAAAHRASSFRSVSENRFTGTNHDYIRDDSHAFILREPSRCIDCGRCANVCKEVVGAACYDFMRTGFDTLVTTPLDMSLNTTPCVSCGRCAETCPTGALMPKPRVLEKYEVDESRCILCGICVDACPYDALRCGPDFELTHDSRAGADDRPAGHQRDRPRHRDELRPPGARLAGAGAGRGRGIPAERLLPMLPAGRRRRTCAGTATAMPRPQGGGHNGHLHAK